MGIARNTIQIRAKENFELIGGHAVLDLVNTLDWRFRDSGTEELLCNYADIVRFVVQLGMLGAMDARRLLRSASESKADPIVISVRELREALATILYASVEGKSPSASSLRTVETSFNEARAHQRLHWEGARLAWKMPQSPSLALPLWLLALSADEFLTSDQMHLLRECRNEECRWLFLDTSKNHTRRWCDMKICGNRMKARRFKAQHRV